MIFALCAFHPVFLYCGFVFEVGEKKEASRMGSESIMCVPVQHLSLISEHERCFHQKETEKNHFHSDTRSVILNPECPCPPSTTPARCPSTQPPSPLPTASAVICGSCVSLLHCFIWPLLCCGQRENSSQTLLFTRAAVGCHIMCPHLLVSLCLCCFGFLAAVPI